MISIFRCACNNKMYKSVESFKAHHRTQGHVLFQRIVDLDKKVTELEQKAYTVTRKLVYIDQKLTRLEK